jgi:predicted nucleic acid-binding protein
MSDKIFIDTNLWIYFFAKNPPNKGERIAEIITNQASLVITSTQVLGELYNVLTRKKIYSRSDAQAIVMGLVNTFPVLGIDTPKVIQALAINGRYGYSYWDSLIIATALAADCNLLYSEDMQNEQLIDNRVTIINPYQG